jgi:hypothetical protein
VVGGLQARQGRSRDPQLAREGLGIDAAEPVHADHRDHPGRRQDLGDRRLLLGGLGFIARRNGAGASSGASSGASASTGAEGMQLSRVQHRRVLDR